jgi:hypothetical protein
MRLSRTHFRTNRNGAPTSIVRKNGSYIQRITPLGRIDIGVLVGGLLDDVYRTGALWDLEGYCGRYCDSVCDAVGIWARCVTYHPRRSTGI